MPRSSSRSRGRHQPVADVIGEDAAAGARDLPLAGRDPTRRDRRRRATPTPSPSSSQRSLACASVFTQARSAAYIGCSGSIASGTPRARACGRSAASRRAPVARAGDVLRAFRQAADDQHQAVRADRGGLVDGAAVVVERGAASGFVGRRKHAAAAEAGDGQAAARGSAAPPASTPQACTMSRHGAIAVMPARAQPSTSCVERPRLHRRRVDRRAASCRCDRSRITPARRGVAITTRMRAAARSGSAAGPAASASRNSSARCNVERALSWPPTMVKWSCRPLR